MSSGCWIVLSLTAASITSISIQRDWAVFCAGWSGSERPLAPKSHGRSSRHLVRVGDSLKQARGLRRHSSYRANHAKEWRSRPQSGSHTRHESQSHGRRSEQPHSNFTNADREHYAVIDSAQIPRPERAHNTHTAKPLGLIAAHQSSQATTAGGIKVSCCPA
jgi:hypothetical protein